ncbi:MAG: tetratricopeptide repeat protein, partial [Candidatus Obscuribacterales bacterium]|nr:tetratricopeptide repeat protein [Candidatus Obscuribacterales bacterium]
MKSLSGMETFLLAVMLGALWCVCATVSADAAKPKRMMKIGEEVVSLQTGQLFVDAQAAIAVQQFDKAESLLNSILQTQPNIAAVRYKLGFVLLQQGKNAQALEQAKRCVELAPTSVNGWAIFGESALNLGQKEQAAQAYRKALAIQPSGENADIMRERLDEIAGKQEDQPMEVVKDPKIDEENRKIMRLNQALALCTEASDHFKQGRFEQGLQDCRDAYKSMPDDRIAENYAVYLNNYAADRVEKQDLKRAEELMKEAVALQAKGGVSKQSRLITLKNYSALLAFLNRVDEAKELSNELCQLGEPGLGFTSLNRNGN